MWRGDEYDFHRIADGVTLPCLDRFTEQQQPWLLHSGRVITPTGAEVRDIIKQVHDIDVIVPGAEPAAQAEITESAPTTQAAPAQPPESILDAALEQAAADDPGDLFPDPPTNPMADAMDKARAENAKLVGRDEDLPASGQITDWEEGVGEAAVLDPGLSREEADSEVERILRNQTEGFDIADEISGLSAMRREQLTEALHRKKARMRRERMTGASPDADEVSIDQLVGLLARRGV
jgi:hypothetical protein